MASYYSSWVANGTNSVSQAYRTRLDLTFATGTSEQNYTDVTWSLYLENGNAKFADTRSLGHVTINGVKVWDYPITYTNSASSMNSSILLQAKDGTNKATGTLRVPHLDNGTKSISYSTSFETVNKSLSYTAKSVMTSSGTIALTTIPRYASITAFTASINDRSASLSWTADKTISQWRWSTNSGSTYSGWATVNASSGSTSLSVSPGSAYGFQIQVINSASGLTTTSSVVSKTATKTPSTLSLSTTSQYVGNNINWTVNESYAYTHKITYYFGNTSGYILGSDSAASDTANGAWTVPMELANQIPNAPSGSGTIYVYTYYGGVHVGTNSYTFTAVVPDNVTFQPTATISSIVQGTTLPSGITVFVQNQSKAKVTSTGTAKYSASINTYSVSVAGIGTYTGSVITSEFLKNSGNVRVTLTVTDSRGLKGSTYQDITVFAYSPPQLPTFNASRSESTPADISANFSASISPINNQNNKYFRMRSKASDGGWIVETDTTQNYTFSGTQIIVSNPDKSYTIEFFVQDSFTSITQTVQVGTAFTLIDFNASGKGMAIGKVSESDSFEVAIPATFMNGITSDGGGNISPSTTAYNYPVGILVDICPASLYNMVFVDVIGNGYSGDVPIHSIFQVYHYEPFGTLIVAKQTNISGNISAGKFLIDGGRLKLWFQQSGVYQTLTVRAYGQNGVPYKVSISNVAEPSATHKTTCSLTTTWNDANSNVITETGSNTNGTYIRFSDGIQICFGIMPIGNASIVQSFPAVFSVVPNVVLTPIVPNITPVVTQIHQITTSTFEIRKWFWTSVWEPAGDLISWIAIGRWK